MSITVRNKTRSQYNTGTWMTRQPVYINNYISIKSTLFQEQNVEQAYDVDDCPITFDTHNVRVCPTNVTIMCSHPV